MLIYIAIVVFVSSLVLCNLFLDKVASNKFINLKINNYHMWTTNITDIVSLGVMILLLVLTAFRSEVIGNDTKTYIDIFFDINSNGTTSFARFEKGFSILCLLIGNFSLDAHFFLVLYSVVLYFLTVIYIIKYSKNITVSVAIFYAYFFSLYTTMLRQDMAMIFCLYAFQYLKQKKYLVSLSLIAIATTFHNTAYVALIMFFYKFIPISIYSSLIVGLNICLLSLTGFVPIICSAVLPVYYLGYFNNQYASSGWLAVSYWVISSAFLYFLVHKSYLFNLEEHRLEIVVFILMFWCNCFGYSMNLFTRVSQYFLLVSVIELPNAIITSNICYKKMIMFLYCMLVLSYFLIVLAYKPEWNRLYPYSFW